MVMTLTRDEIIERDIEVTYLGRKWTGRFIGRNTAFPFLALFPDGPKFEYCWETACRIAERGTCTIK